MRCKRLSLRGGAVRAAVGHCRGSGDVTTGPTEEVCSGSAGEVLARVLAREEGPADDGDVWPLWPHGTSCRSTNQGFFVSTLCDLRLRDCRLQGRPYRDRTSAPSRVIRIGLDCRDPDLIDGAP